MKSDPVDLCIFGTSTEYVCVRFIPPGSPAVDDAAMAELGQFGTVKLLLRIPAGVELQYFHAFWQQSPLDPRDGRTKEYMLCGIFCAYCAGWNAYGAYQERRGMGRRTPDVDWRPIRKRWSPKGPGLEDCKNTDMMRALLWITEEEPAPEPPLDPRHFLGYGVITGWHVGKFTPEFMN